MTISADPFAAQLLGTVTILSMSGDASVYVSFPKQLATGSTPMPVGTAANTAAVWAKTRATNSPLTATMGSAFVD